MPGSLSGRWPFLVYGWHLYTCLGGTCVTFQPIPKIQQASRFECVSSLIWVHPVLENNRMCQKSHKSFQRTTGQTTFFFFFFFFFETDGLGVTSTSNSPLTIQRGHFMKKLVILYTY